MSKPTKAKSLVPKTADELGLDKNLVQDAVDFYFVKLRKMMQSLDHHRVNVPYLGTFEIRKNRLEGLIRKTGHVLENKPIESFTDAKKYYQLEDRYSKAVVLAQKIEEDEQEREKRYEDLGKPRRNTRGSKKQTDQE